MFINEFFPQAVCILWKIFIANHLPICFKLYWIASNNPQFGIKTNPLCIITWIGGNTISILVLCTPGQEFMKGYTVLFSICFELVFRRRDIINFIQSSLPGLRVTSIDLNDRQFTMSVNVQQYKAGLIEDTVAQKGLKITLLRIEENIL